MEVAAAAAIETPADSPANADDKYYVPPGVFLAAHINITGKK